MKFAVIDFETTGDQPYDEIIQVGLVIIDNNEIIDQYSSYIAPKKSIPSFITQLTGISDEMVAQAPAIDEVLPEIMVRLSDCILVGHSIAFDLAFLQTALRKAYYAPFAGRVLDTLELLRMLYPGISSLQLSMVSSELNIPHDRPHQADSDAEATAHIWLRCMSRLDELPLLTMQRLSHIFEPSESDLGWFFNERRSERELSTVLDMNTGQYFRQFALKVQDWTEEQSAREDDWNPAELNDSFEPFYGQLKEDLQQQFDNYEDRSAQDIMINEVFESFEQDRHLMVEAGTGTGKSLGYLIPALFYGIKHNKKVLVSTHTINLQEQLRQRDIPLLQQLFPVPFRAAVLKGRSHYLCLRKFEHKINGQDFAHEAEDRITAAQMVVWLGETEHGDDEEIHLGYKGQDFWHTVASDTDSCLNRACPWFKKCFYHRARQEANVSDVIITNHSLLFTDVKADNRLLPAYQHLVVDEAHHFEEVASKHLGIDVQYFAFNGTLTWLYKDSRSGQLPILRAKLQKVEDEKAADWVEAIDHLYEKVVNIKETWDQLCELLFDIVSGNQSPIQGEQGQFVLRIKSEAIPPQWETTGVMEDNIFIEVSEVVKTVERIMNEMKDDQEDYDTQGIVTDLSGTLKELMRHRDALRFFMKRNDPNYVYWMEASSQFKARSLQLYCAPIDVSAMLQQYFFEVKDSVVLTSATLSVDKSFQYSCEQLGLAAANEIGKLKAVQLPSPFNYRKQALVCIPRDFPGVKGALGETYFIEQLVTSLRDVAIETKGRMLVLFTSNRMLRQVYTALKEQLQSAGIHLLGQGIDSGNRSKLTRMFQNSMATVLLGTSSFWEGVDIPGDALSCLAIVRLPFQPPSQPMNEAKSEMLIKQKKNPFINFSVPQAVIRFKQGFGRLVRTSGDRGIVIIYDTRVLDTYYGKYFLHSLPGPKIEHMSSAHLVPRIKEWFEEGVSI